MTAPTNLAPDQVRQDYIARCYKMSHAELFAELMRVHTEAHRLVSEAKREWVGLTEDEAIELLPAGDWAVESTLDFAKAIEAKLKEKNS